MEDYQNYANSLNETFSANAQAQRLQAQRQQQQEERKEQEQEPLNLLGAELIRTGINKMGADYKKILINKAKQKVGEGVQTVAKKTGSKTLANIGEGISKGKSGQELIQGAVSDSLDEASQKASQALQGVQTEAEKQISTVTQGVSDKADEIQESLPKLASTTEKTPRQIQNERRMAKQKLRNQQIKDKSDSQRLKQQKADEEAKQSIANLPDAEQELKDKIYGDNPLDEQVQRDVKKAQGLQQKTKNIAQIQQEEDIKRRNRAKTMAQELEEQKNKPLAPVIQDVEQNIAEPVDSQPKSLSLSEQIKQKQQQIGLGQEEIGSTDPLIKAGTQQESIGATEGTYQERGIKIKSSVKKQPLYKTENEANIARDAVNEKIGNLSNEDYETYKRLRDKNNIAQFDYPTKSKLVDRIESKSLEERYNKLPTQQAQDDYIKGLKKRKVTGIEGRKALMNDVENFHQNLEDTSLVPVSEEEVQPEAEPEVQQTEGLTEPEEQQREEREGEQPPQIPPVQPQEETSPEETSPEPQPKTTEETPPEEEEEPKPDISKATKVETGGEDALETATAESTALDENPLGDLVTVGLGLASILAPLFSHKQQESPQAPMNQNSAFGET